MTARDPVASAESAYEPLRLTVEFARQALIDDPYAFQFTPQSYIVHTPGGGFSSAEMPWDAALLADLQSLRGPRWEPAAVQRLGERLRKFLATTGWAHEEQRIVEAVRRGQPIFLSVRSAAAELYALPWELMTIKSTGQHIGELPGLVVRYEWPETSTVREQAAERGRVLFAWSAAAGQVPASEHLAAISRACAATGHPFDPHRDVLPHASSERLVATLRAASEQHAPYTMLHLLCHGAAHGGTFGLALAGADGDDVAVVDAGRLRQLLAPFAPTLRLVVLAACDGGNIGALGNHLGSVAQTLHRAGLQAVLASRFPLSIVGSNRLVDTLYDHILVRRAPVEAAVTAARAGLARDAASLDWACLQYYARAADGDETRPLYVRPYRGLLPFRPEHRWAFFGRDEEIAELRAQLGNLVERREPRFVVVAGAAGVGKTSLVLAGLVPALRADPGTPWTHLEISAGHDPIADLAAALARLAGIAVEPTTDGAWTALQSWQSRHPERALLIVLDALEDLFIQTAAPAARTAFLRLLWRMARSPASRTAVVASLRIDFVGRCGEVVLDEDTDLRLDQVAYDDRHRLFVAQLGIPQLRAAIAQPARAVGVDLDPGLVERIVADVAGQPGALPMVQHALSLLWQQRKERRLTLAAYDAIGGVAGALERHAEGVVQRLNPSQLQQARRALVRLASARADASGETGRRLPIDQITPQNPADEGAFREALSAMTQARLVVLGEQAGARNVGKQTTAELVHDALLQRWQRLREWVREDRARVVELLKIELWVHEWQDHGALLDGHRLGYALEVASRSREDLSAEALRLVALSQAEAEAVKQAELQRRAELEGMLEATQDLLSAADADMQRVEADLVRARGLAWILAAVAIGAVIVAAAAVYLLVRAVVTATLYA